MNEFHRVGVIGLGRMGLPMARHLLHAGFEVAGFDLDPARGAALAEGGGVAAASAKEVAAYSQAVLVMVADDAQVKAVTLEPVGVLSGLESGGGVIIASTVKPSTCREVAAAAAAGGVDVLDGPVAKGQRAAETGTLTVFVGGEAGELAAHPDADVDARRIAPGERRRARGETRFRGEAAMSDGHDVQRSTPAVTIGRSRAE